MVVTVVMIVLETKTAVVTWMPDVYRDPDKHLYQNKLVSSALSNRDLSTK